MKYICNAKAYIELMSRKKRNEDTIKLYESKLELLEEYLIPEYEKLHEHFKSFTKHDWVHTIKVLDYMFDLLDNPKELSEEQLMLIIFTALLHDIGMACSQDEIKIWMPNIEFSDSNKVTEIIRVRHGEYAAIKIKQIPEIENPKSLADLFKVHGSAGSKMENWDLTNIVAAVCRSHTESIQWLQVEFENDPNALHVACLLRLADLLDIDGNRADFFYQFSNKIGGDSKIHYTFNQIVGDSEKVKKYYESACEKKCPRGKKAKYCGNSYTKIELTITFPLDLDSSTESAIWRMISDYRDDVESEIRNVNSLLNNLDKEYRIRVLPDVEYRFNHTQTATHSRLESQKLSVDYSAIRSILSEEQLYPNKLYGIREIMQNAYDACKAFSDTNIDEYGWEAQIIIDFDSSNNILIIRDNGIGMTDFVIKEYFLNIGKSIYNFEPNYLYEDYHKDHIGHFGLGFFAAFMLSEKINMKTQSYQNSTSIRVELDKNSSYATLIYNCPTIVHGTEVVLHLDDVCDSLKMKSVELCYQLLIDYIADTFLFDGIKIYYNDRKKKELSELRLKSVLIDGWTIISKYFMKIDASINICTKRFPPIFYAISSGELEKVTYEELLEKLANDKNGSREEPYLDAGYFLVFSGDEKIKSDFSDKVTRLSSRKNYSMLSQISDSIDVLIMDFCKDNNLNMPTHCDYGILDLVVEGNNAVLCERNVICAEHKTNMRKYDACGEAQRDDRLYLRDVFLPLLHICVPNVNFRYDLKGLMANIKTDDVFPTLARDTLTDERVRELSYAMGYAIAQLEFENSKEMAENKLIVEYLYKKIDNNAFIKEKV